MTDTTDRELTFEDDAPREPALDEATEEAAPAANPMAMPAPQPGAVPDWVIIPQGMKFPKGASIVFMRFKLEYEPSMEFERQCIAWPLNIPDQKLALQRSMGDSARAVDEMTKQMLRAIDGHRVDWSGLPGPANIDQWWDRIGPKNRNILNRIFTQTHVPSTAQVADFFENCVAVRMGT